MSFNQRVDTFRGSIVTDVASASTALNDMVACVTPLCRNGYSPIFSTTPDVEHFVFGHPAPSMSTRNLKICSSLVEQQETEQTTWPSFEVSCDSCDLCRPPKVGFETSRITSYFAKVVSCFLSLMYWHNPANERLSRWPYVYTCLVQLLVCCRCFHAAWCHHCLCLAHARLCPARSVRNASTARHAIYNCLRKFFA